MALTPDQRFFGEVLWVLLGNGEDFRIIWNHKEYHNIGNHLYCDGVLLPEYCVQ
jgi:hypothetical protein